MPLTRLSSIGRIAWADLLLAAMLLLATPLALAQSPTSTPLPRYEWRQTHDPDGIGKFYHGREIAQVMGHQAADWLERPERESEERPDLLLQSLAIKPREAIADIGAGSGYLSVPMARLVGPRGKIYAVDIQPEMLDLLRRKAAAEHVTNILPVLGTITNANLSAESVDLAVMVDVYHEFSFPFEMVQSICSALKPGGRLAFVEYRGEDPTVPIKPLHKMTEAQVRAEVQGQSLEWVKTISVLPRQHIIVFKKR